MTPPKLTYLLTMSPIDQNASMCTLGLTTAAFNRPSPSIARRLQSHVAFNRTSPKTAKFPISVRRLVGPLHRELLLRSTGDPNSPRQEMEFDGSTYTTRLRAVGLLSKGGTSSG